MSPVRVRAILLLASFVGGFLAVVLTWTGTVPPFRGSDERDHVFRSDAVAHGHVLPEHADREGARGGLLTVRRSVVDAARPSCQALTYLTPEDCRATWDPDGDAGLVASGAARYNPSYYLVTGLAALPFEGLRAMTAMRVGTALLCAGLLAVAFAVATSRRRTSWPAAGLILTMTPTVTFSAGTATPNGVHLIAAVLVWLSAVELRDALGEAREPSRLLWGGLALGGLTLMHTHALGVVWLALILTACAISAARPRAVLGRALRSAPRLPALAVFVAGAGGLLWSLAVNPNDPGREHMTADASVFPGALIQPFLWFMQSFVTTSGNWRLASWWIYVVAVVAVAALLFVALPRSSRPERRALVFVAAAWVLVPMCLTLATLEQMGFAWQGRYSLPVAFGVVVLACQALDRAPLVRPGLPVAAAAAATALMTGGAQFYWLGDHRSAVTLVLTASITGIGFAAMAVSAWLSTTAATAGFADSRHDGLVRTDYPGQSFGSVSAVRPRSDGLGS